MNFIKTEIEGLVIVEPKVFGDHRGFFMESWSERAFAEAGLNYTFVQDNHSSSTVKGTLRGIHFQRGDKAQAKLVRCRREGKMMYYMLADDHVKTIIGMAKEHIEE